MRQVGDHREIKNKMDITQKTLDELKSLAYDQLILLERARNNLNLLNQEIAKQIKELKSEEEPKG